MNDLQKLMLTDEELEKLLMNADIYLSKFGDKKNLSWFDMSHLLSCLLPQYTKEQILELWMQIYEKINKPFNNK